MTDAEAWGSPRGISVREQSLAGHRAVMLENSEVAVTVLPARGGEIHSIVLRSRNFDILWKAPWGLPPPRPTVTCCTGSEAAWMDNYAGGWQGIFPNGGDSCVYRGAILGFHGEASTIEWPSHIERSAASVSLLMEARLVRSPFRITRKITIEQGRSSVMVEESIANESDEYLHAMWGHHPALAAELLAGARIETSARRYESGQPEIHPSGRVKIGPEHFWPLVQAKSGAMLDLSVLPDMRDQAAEYGFLSGFDEGRYRIVNDRLALAVECTWDLESFPYLWFWLEWAGSRDYPWYGRCRVGALEPFSSIPGAGLNAAIDRGTAILFEGGQTRSTRLQLSIETSAPSKLV